MNEALVPMQDIAADEMAQMTYQALISLHAALAFHLEQTGRPLPRLLNFHFNQSSPTLVMAYRLYANAGRADELRDENKNVHPAFMLPTGRALSS
jgi:prophage DNA circulation protein